VEKTIVASLQPWKALTLTVTSDNGKEFAHHKQIAKSLGTDFYFAHPYAAWERGSNENMNGLLRQYFPKKRNLADVPDEEVDYVISRLNNRPRKCLAYQTPFEVFLEQSVALDT
jgi:IS30 family transposase